MRNKYRYIHSQAISILIAVLFLAEIAVIVMSWVGSALSPDSGIQSMLSAEGVRWYVGSLSALVAKPLLVFIILIGVTIGIVQKSGVLAALRNMRTIYKPMYRKDDTNLSGTDFYMHYSERLGLQLFFVSLLIEIVVIILLTFIPHAVLVNSHGSIFGSSFSRGIIPMLCFCCSLSASIYGACSNHFPSIRILTNAIIHGISMTSPYIFIYLLAAQLYYSIIYILM